jgi:hypothetical protein
VAGKESFCIKAAAFMITKNTAGTAVKQGEDKAAQAAGTRHRPLPPLFIFHYQ